MVRSISCLVAPILTIFLTTQACGQIDYEEIPDPPIDRNERIVHRYETTWGLRDDPAHTFSMGPGGPFKTKEAAEDQLKRKFAETKGNGFWSVTHGLITRRPYVKSASGDESEPVDSAESNGKSKISGTVLGIVDPGGNANSLGRKKSVDGALLVGKKFKGAIGEVVIFFEFVNATDVKISSLVQQKSLDAKWRFDEEGLLRIDANADFVAVRRGNKFEGTRTAKNGKDVRKWQFNFVDDLGGDIRTVKGNAYNDPRIEETQSTKSELAKLAEGYWVRRYQSGVDDVGYTYYLKSDSTLEIFRSHHVWGNGKTTDETMKLGRKLDSKGTWQVDGSVVRFEYRDLENKYPAMKTLGEIKGGEMFVRHPSDHEQKHAETYRRSK